MSDDLRLSRAAARRGCGLAVADVMQDADTGLWTIDVCANKFRQLKRTWTARQLPIHEELLRLGFLEYVEAIRALGYEPLFPDLLPTPREARSATSWLTDGSRSKWAPFLTANLKNGRFGRTGTALTTN